MTTDLATTTAKTRRGYVLAGTGIGSTRTAMNDSSSGTGTALLSTQESCRAKTATARRGHVLACRGITSAHIGLLAEQESYMAKMTMTRRGAVLAVAQADRFRLAKVAKMQRGHIFADLRGRANSSANGGEDVARTARTFSQPFEIPHGEDMAKVARTHVQVLEIPGEAKTRTFRSPYGRRSAARRRARAALLSVDPMTAGRSLPADPSVPPELMIRAVLDGVDAVATAMERKWGVGRLRLLVGDDLRARFDAQRARLDAAIASNRESYVRAQAEGMKRAWAALDLAATQAGASRAEVWDCVLPSTGEVVAIVRGDPASIATSGQRVFTLDEVARLIDGLPEAVGAVKQAFPGSEITEVRRKSPVNWQTGDEVSL